MSIAVSTGIWYIACGWWRPRRCFAVVPVWFNRLIGDLSPGGLEMEEPRRVEIPAAAAALNGSSSAAPHKCNPVSQRSPFYSKRNYWWFHSSSSNYTRR